MSISTPTHAPSAADSSHSFAGLPEGSAERFQNFVRNPGRLLIDGEWVDAVSGKTFETFNPATEESLGSVAHGAAEDIELAVAAARRCFDDEHSDWRRMTPSERGKLIYRIGDLIEQHADERLNPRQVDRAVLPVIALVKAGHAWAEDFRHGVTLDSSWPIGLVSRIITEPMAQ